MKPPSPPCGPPLALTAPENLVWPSDQTTALPPLPAPVASAAMAAPASTTVTSAGATGLRAGRMLNPASRSGVARPPR